MDDQQENPSSNAVAQAHDDVHYKILALLHVCHDSCKAARKRRIYGDFDGCFKLRVYFGPNDTFLFKEAESLFQLLQRPAVSVFKSQDLVHFVEIHSRLHSNIGLLRRAASFLASNTSLLHISIMSKSTGIQVR